MRVVIVANGELAAGQWLKPYLETAALLIAADGGGRHLYRLDWPPDLVIGDMDSLGEAERAWFLSAETPRFLSYPADKDQTDLELALAYALEQGADDILIAGAFGGRIDHQLANIFLLARPELAGHRVRLLDAGLTLEVLDPGAHTLPGAPGDLLTLLPLAGDVFIEQTEGLRWPLQQEWLKFGAARGVSNVVSAENPVLVIAVGRLLCVRLGG